MMIKTSILQLHLLLKIGKKVKLATMFLSKLELEDTFPPTNNKIRKQ